MKPTPETASFPDFRIAGHLARPMSNRIETADRSIRVFAKTMQVLVCLAGRAGSVTSKEHLLSSVWPDAFVTEAVLTNAIWELRRAFRHGGGKRAIIETIPRRGYRLAAPVSPVGGNGGSASARMQAAQPGRIDEHEASVAILPFVDIPHSPELREFCEGLVEEITNELANVKGLRVVARTSSACFQGSSEDVRTIGRKLGASLVIEGSVRRWGKSLRVTVQLIDTSTGYHRWSQRYDVSPRDPLSAQDEIARDVASRFHQVSA